MKTASFTVRASERQSARWKQAAEAEGFASVGAWLAGAADAYLKVRARAGMPVPLAWHRGLFRAILEGGETTVRGYVSPPFGAYYGTPAGQPSYRGKHRYTLVYLPSKRVLATVETYVQCKVLASELARIWFREDGSEPSGNPGPVLMHPA
ncbi:MAG TPA: hypothetical protein VF789_26775 [Thermoanaerobaculia bacterium]